MPSTDASSPPPLAAGESLYGVQDTTLIYVPDGASQARYQRMTFTGLDHVAATATDPIDLGPMEAIRTARVVTHASGRQEVILLTAAGLSVIAHDGQTSRLTTLPVAPGWRVEGERQLIIGFAPDAPDKRLLVLLTSSGIELIDLDGKPLPGWVPLLEQVRGTPVAAELVRHGSSTMLVIATVQDTDHSLMVQAVAWGDLADRTKRQHKEPLHVETLTLGTAVAPQVAAAVVRMRKGSPHQQQLALTWADKEVIRDVYLVDTPRGSSSSPAPSWTCQIALVGWGADGEFAVLARAAPDLSFAPPTNHRYALAASNFKEAGEQLVLGCSALIEEPGQGGHHSCVYHNCAVLMPFVLEEHGKSPAVLKLDSRYLVYPTKDRDYFDRHTNNACELYLAAGVFGTYKGVQVTWGDVVDVQCGFVQVDPVSGFPRESGKMERLVTHQGGHYLAFPSDLTGQSVLLGPPRFEQKSDCGQILAIIQAHPYDHRVAANLPSVSFSTTSSETTGLSLSRESSWTLSDDTIKNLGLGALSGSLSTHIAQLKSLSRVDDTSSSKSVTLHSSFTSHDYVLVSEISYNVWRYPVLRGSARNPAGGELLVVHPLNAEPTTSWRPAHEYGYRPRSEVGMLFSYINAEKEGYTPDGRLFTLTGYEVAEKQDTASINYDLSKSATRTASTHLSILNSVSEHSGLTAATELFDFLPVNFGLNQQTSHSYSENQVETTHLMVHSGLNLGVHSGSVEHALHEYNVTPVIYRHDKLGCLMLAWEVSLGNGWKRADTRVTAAQPCLIRPLTNSGNKIYDQFSRSISFVERDGTIDIEVEIFNNGLREAPNVSCEFFDVSKEFSPGLPADIKQLTLPEHLLGKVQLPGGLLNPLGRGKVTLSGQKLTKPVYISVKLFMGGIPFGVYWGVHPPEKFFA